MRNNSLYQLITFTFIICKIFCQEISILSNYTRPNLLNIKQKVTCTNDNDCPFNSYCDTHLNSCIFDFLCPEADNEPCLSLNTTMWNPDIEDVVDSFEDKSYRPILKTCDINNIGKNMFTKLFAYCYTERCTENTDCYSGKCEYGTCIRNKTIYRCANNVDNIENIFCAKNNQMTCNTNEECFSHFCKKSTCDVDETNPIYMGLIVIVIFILFIIFAIYKFAKSKKQEKDQSKYKEMA
ncbi:hypothetical protein BCR32DRAFT_268291 [Anaeromyces robustus]|uniref:Dickkopf N-terminal cysteine-rich domain-containing protein n=1 Tax=Anaeromyces robustus TaxID=1754192 RepID=A0A1Y1X6U9_9FUNG|nr:hypothetical protein BCR32DRAFT_268291 [Anaeromyces robustus]|eukprot:ORX81442.1 hypothetical protein BCR32DRAFT_268291 [Anaeromyces robustus]